MPKKNFLVFKNAKILTPMRVIDKGLLIVTGEEISYVGSKDKVNIPENARIIDVAGKYLTPGFIDIHLHGGGGANAVDATQEALEKISVVHSKGGATSIVPTITTSPINDMIKAIEVIELAKGRHYPEHRS